MIWNWGGRGRDREKQGGWRGRKAASVNMHKQLIN